MPKCAEQRTNLPTAAKTHNYCVHVYFNSASVHQCSRFRPSFPLPARNRLEHNIRAALEFIPVKQHCSWQGRNDITVTSRGQVQYRHLSNKSTRKLNHYKKMCQTQSQAPHFKWPTRACNECNLHNTVLYCITEVLCPYTKYARMHIFNFF